MTSKPETGFGKEEEKKEKYPKAVFFILGNEFCERFCYYGMRTILTIYLTEELRYSDSLATVIFHAFIMLSYFTPLFGALLADSLLGKYRTILYISIVYAIGNIILSVGSIPNEMSTMKAISLIGLLIIGIGTGGIKPCVSAFGGDQFSNNQEQLRQKFFSIFYFAINSGSVISTLATPVLRADVHCFGSDSCYPLAYGVPAILMLVALALFLMGKPLYKIRPREGNIFVDVFKCICYALTIKSKSKEKKKKDHWLEHADDKFDRDLIKDIQTLLHVLWVFIPLPVFWALFDQTGSSWTLQATKMDGYMLGYHIKPDQMQVMNAIMIIVLIPVFDYAVYPLFNKCNLLTKPLQRIAAGGFLVAVAFVAAGLVELSLEKGYPVYPEAGLSELTIINNSPCRILISDRNLNIDPFQVSTISDLPMATETSWKFSPQNCSASQNITKNFNTTSQIESMMITLQNNALEITQSIESKKRSDEGDAKIKIFFSTDYDFSGTNQTFKFDDNHIKPNNGSSKFGMTEYYNIMPGKYNVYSPFNDTSHNSVSIGEVELKSGGIYLIMLYESSNEKQSFTHTLVKHNSISILWQIPAYLILTAGEIMFSITGLEFSYSQAPQSMKSVVQAAWLLTVAFGNLIVMIIAELSLFEKKSYELFMFAILMTLDMGLFAIMAYYYKYVDGTGDKTVKPAARKTSGKDNEGYEEETDFTK